MSDPLPPRAHWTSAASGTERCLGGFLNVLDVDAARCADHPDSFGRLRSGELQAVVVHDVLSTSEAGALVEQLARHDPAFVQSSFPAPFRSGFYGRNLNLADPQLRGYFDEAGVFNRQLGSLQASGRPLAAIVSGLLSALDRGRPFIAAHGPAPHDRYMFTTLRMHREHGYIPAHFDNEARLRPSYRHLATQVEPLMQSFVLTLDPADAGGALEVFDLRCPIEEARLLNDDHATAKPDTATLASVCFRLPAGTMIVLDSGRQLHRVTPVEGPRLRWTACSFMALARDGQTMQCWG